MPADFAPPPVPSGQWGPPTDGPSLMTGPYLSPPAKNRAAVVMLVAAASGWGILCFARFLMLFADSKTECSANRGDRYQDCVRGSDLTGLGVHALVIGLAMVGLVVMIRAGRRRAGLDHYPAEHNAGWASVALLVVSIVFWIYGILGGWEPDRLFPYEPVSASQASLIMSTGVFIGAAVGAVFPLGGRE